MDKYFCIEFSMVGLTVILALIFVIYQPAYAQRNDAEKLFTEISKTLNAPPNQIEIHSVAECKGPDGAYTTVVKSDSDNLKFSQVFSYRDEHVELNISGGNGTDANGEPISEFMIFYGRMHDYVRIALQPEYLLHTVDSVIKRSESIMIIGKTDKNYSVRYVIDSQKLPVWFTFHLDDEHPITTWFEEWMIINAGIKVPKTVRIVDGEKEFLFRYTEISIEEMEKDK